MTDKIVVFSTCESAEEAGKIGRELVEKRLAACVQVTPGIRSFYWWKDEVVEGGEFLLVIKSRRDLFDRLQTELRRLHSYEVPESLAVSVVDGSQDYLDWMEKELEPPISGE